MPLATERNVSPFATLVGVIVSAGDVAVLAVTLTGPVKAAPARAALVAMALYILLSYQAHAVPLLGCDPFDGRREFKTFNVACEIRSLIR